MSKVYLVVPHIHSGKHSRRASASTPTRFFLFFLPSLRLDRANFLAERNRPLAILVSNSGKSAVGPAEYRLTLSNRPFLTSCFPTALNASFTSLGEYIAGAIVNLLDDLLQRVLLPAMLPFLSCSSPISFFHAQIPARCHHQPTPKPATHRTLHQMYQEMSTHEQLSLVRFDARSRVLSFLVLHFVNLGLRSFLTRIEQRAEGGCMARFQSGLSLSSLVRGPRIVRRHES